MSRQQAQFAHEPTSVPPPGDPPKPAAPSAHLWLCLHFPYLSLEVLRGATDVPRAVIVKHRREARVLHCNSTAAACGVREGLSASAALALAPALELLERDPQAETKALTALANWANRFTPMVSLEAPAALLLDIRASLRLFGGLDALRALIAEGLQVFGYRARLACAPTPKAALWLARAGHEVTVMRSDELPGRLASLPLTALGWPESTQRLLARAGVHSVGDCNRLPRDGLAKRIGPQRFRELDRAFGRCPDPLSPHISPRDFHEALDMPLEITDSALLNEPLRILLDRLGHRLRIHQAAVEFLWVSLRYEHEPPTMMRVGLAKPAADIAYLEELVRLRLADARFPAPVVGVTIRTRLMDYAPEPGRDLFGRAQAHCGEFAALLDRLRVRLGDRSVYGIRTRGDHRPESAWQRVAEPLSPAVEKDLPEHAPSGRRPVWMLEAPIPVDSDGGRPLYHGRLCLEDGPERIETGWWDGEDVRRDYYVARHRCGMRLWLFRDLRDARWYLHGIFG